MSANSNFLFALFLFVISSASLLFCVKVYERDKTRNDIFETARRMKLFSAAHVLCKTLEVMFSRSVS